MSQQQSIANGNIINIEDVPWQVSTGQITNDGYLHQCGGAILNERWILTAAHCTPQAGDFVHAGTNLAGDFSQGILVEIAEVVIHPDFDINSPSHGGCDIALLRLADDLCLSSNSIQAIDIPSPFYSLNVGESLLHSGYSNVGNGTSGPNLLRGADIPLISHTAAIQQFDCITALNDWILPTSNSINGANSGDSGGPVVHFDSNNVPTLVGIMSWSCYEPSAPAWLTLSANLIELNDFVTNNITTPNTSMTTLSGALAGTYESGPYYLDGNVTVGDYVDLVNSTIYVAENSSLTFNSGSNVWLDDIKFIPCDGSWKGITVEDGSTVNMRNTFLSKAVVGIDLNNFSNFNIQNVTIVGCDRGMEIVDDTGTNGANTSLSFVKFVSSPFYASNVDIELLGCKFSDSDLQLDNVNTHVEREAISSWNLRSAFYNSDTYINGGSYNNMFSYFESSRIRTNRFEGELVSSLNISHCSINGKTIRLRDVDKFEIMTNVFRSNQSSSEAINASNYASSSNNTIEENVFIKKTRDINIYGGENVECFCNYHDETVILPYRTTKLMTQGNSEFPAANVFNTPSLLVDITPADPYIYFFDETNLATYPKLESDNDLILLEGEFVLDEHKCMTKEDILFHWEPENVDLCPPGSWLANEECYDICTLCVDCESLPRREGGWAGKLVDDKRSESLMSLGSDSDISLVQSTSSIIIDIADSSTAAYFSLIDLNGKQIFSNTLGFRENVVSKNGLPSGIYIVLIKSKDGQLLESETIVIE